VLLEIQPWQIATATTVVELVLACLLYWVVARRFRGSEQKIMCLEGRLVKLMRKPGDRRDWSDDHLLTEYDWRRPAI